MSRSAHRTPNFTNPEYFVYSLFEYFFQINVLYWYQNTPKNANITLYIKKEKPLCYTINWGNWNSGFVKLGVRWAERDISLNSNKLITLNYELKQKWFHHFLSPIIHNICFDFSIWEIIVKKLVKTRIILIWWAHYRFCLELKVHEK